jgi:hypothetical protein
LGWRFSGLPTPLCAAHFAKPLYFDVHVHGCSDRAHGIHGGSWGSIHFAAESPDGYLSMNYAAKFEKGDNMNFWKPNNRTVRQALPTRRERLSVVSDRTRWLVPRPHSAFREATDRVAEMQLEAAASRTAMTGTNVTEDPKTP